MTGLASRRASSIARFCTSGTSSRGISTPRSPRATMMPSKAATMPSRLSTACGFSILAMTGMRSPNSSMIAWTSTMSSAERTKDSAIMSTPRRMAKRRSSRSFSDRAGTLTATPGRLMPLLLLTTPPMTVSVSTSVSVDLDRAQHDLAVVDEQDVAGVTSPGRPAYVVPTMLSSPSTSRVVMVKRCAAAQRHGAGGEACRSGSWDPAGRRGCRRRGPRRLAGGTDVAVDLLVHGVVAVREVQPRDVHPGVDEGAQLRG